MAQGEWGLFDKDLALCKDGEACVCLVSCIKGDDLGGEGDTVLDLTMSSDI